MDIFASGIPDIKISKIGTRRYSYEIIQAPIILEAWDGYLYERWANGKKITDKTIYLDFGVYNRDISVDWLPQINAYHHLIQNQYAIRDSIIRSLIDKFEWLKETYDWDQDDDFTPETKADFDFKPFIGPVGVSFHDEESRNGISYLEWHFNCAWDEEHGLAVITHQERVIDLDRGETDPWKIYEDNGTLAEKQKEYDEWAKNVKPKIQKPWWQFW
ncbi:MAG: hypothetical protein M3209_18850 [Acidobacteriota bacterium]|nr:hypothetical protein [Acidobacteriota bacterium]